jgi:hypothetical protein
MIRSSQLRIGSPPGQPSSSVHDQIPGHIPLLCLETVIICTTWGFGVRAIEDSFIMSVARGKMATGIALLSLGEIPECQ